MNVKNSDDHVTMFIIISIIIIIIIINIIIIIIIIITIIIIIIIMFSSANQTNFRGAKENAFAFSGVLVTCYDCLKASMNT